MAKAHTVSFASRHCTVRLTYGSRKEARRACAGIYGTKWDTLMKVLPCYEGFRRVPNVKIRRRRGPPPPLVLERVPIIDLFFTDYPGHHARARQP